MVNYYVYDKSKFATLFDALDKKQAFNANKFININNDVEVSRLIDFLSDCFGFEVTISSEIL